MSEKIKMPEYQIVGLKTDLSHIRDEVDSVFSKWEDLYDERSCNEPEYDSQIDKWQEALDRLEEDKDLLESANENFEEWIESFEEEAEDCTERTATYRYHDIDIGRFTSILNEYMDVNSSRKGLTRTIKRLKDVLDVFNMYRDK